MIGESSKQKDKKNLSSSMPKKKIILFTSGNINKVVMIVVAVKIEVQEIRLAEGLVVVIAIFIVNQFMVFMVTRR